jgi:hypothetical protein
VHGHASAFWTQRPHEFCGFWFGHETLHLASASDTRARGLVPLVLPHTFRFVGLAFLVPGVVSPSLPPAFAAPAAYGDLIAAILAIVATVALSRHVPWAALLVWLFNVWGAMDLLFAFYQGLLGVQLDPRMLGAAFFIATVIVPPLLITHGMIFWLLVRPKH